MYMEWACAHLEEGWATQTEAAVQVSPSTTAPTFLDILRVSTTMRRSSSSWV